MTMLPINSLTVRSRKVLTQAGSIAQEHDQNYVGTEHILLAICENVWCLASQVLELAGVRDQIDQKLREIIASGGRAGPPPDFGDEAIVRFAAERENLPLTID